MYTDTRTEKPANPVVAQGIKPGDPASLVYVTDTRAAVVTKVSPKTITIAMVETGEAAPNDSFDRGAWGLAVVDAPGILDKIIEGTERRCTWNARRNGWFTAGQRVILGRSVSRRDWRD